MSRENRAGVLDTVAAFEDRFDKVTDLAEGSPYKGKEDQRKRIDFNTEDSPYNQHTDNASQQTEKRTFPGLLGADDTIQAVPPKEFSTEKGHAVIQPGDDRDQQEHMPPHLPVLRANDHDCEGPEQDYVHQTCYQGHGPCACFLNRLRRKQDFQEERYAETGYSPDDKGGKVVTRHNSCRRQKYDTRQDAGNKIGLLHVRTGQPQELVERQQQCRTYHRGQYKVWSKANSGDDEGRQYETGNYSRRHCSSLPR